MGVGEEGGVNLFEWKKKPQKVGFSVLTSAVTQPDLIPSNELDY